MNCESKQKIHNLAFPLRKRSLPGTNIKKIGPDGNRSRKLKLTAYEKIDYLLQIYA